MELLIRLKFRLSWSFVALDWSTTAASTARTHASVHLTTGFETSSGDTDLESM